MSSSSSTSFGMCTSSSSPYCSTWSAMYKTWDMLSSSSLFSGTNWTKLYSSIWRSGRCVCVCVCVCVLEGRGYEDDRKKQWTQHLFPFSWSAHQRCNSLTKTALVSASMIQRLQFTERPRMSVQCADLDQICRSKCKSARHVTAHIGHPRTCLK